MNKKILIFLLVIVSVFSLFGCGKATKEVNVSVAEIAGKIKDEVEFSAMLELKAEEIEEKYFINPDIIEESVVEIPLMNVKADELAIIKVKDEKDIDKVNEGIKKRAESVQKTFETYLPNQYENAKNYTLKNEGKYILFIISDNNEKIESIFDGYFK
ncbi:DUF4358 domain-containing protein [uncultured Clostridium sp.]|uniref:DUF4358 domain-containing protein n=1 Tax=uncultured Clostridium sp. TaxID=59620 RepID=UPI0028E673AD|nr:DUF4358 domain-containing protein [uncultured Clostridium sp.]